MSDFTDSLRNEDDNEIKKFVLELFDRVDDLHDASKNELEEAYHQGEKDALRRVLAVMTNSDVDMIIPSSVIAYKLRGEIKTVQAELFEALDFIVKQVINEANAHHTLGAFKRGVGIEMAKKAIAKAKGES